MIAMRIGIRREPLMFAIPRKANGSGVKFKGPGAERILGQLTTMEQLDCVCVGAHMSCSSRLDEKTLKASCSRYIRAR
jgi:hypothetical protein